MSFRDFF